MARRRAVQTGRVVLPARRQDGSPLVGRIESDLEDATADVAALDGRLGVAEADIDQLEIDVSALDGRVTQNESDIVALQNAVAALEAGGGGGVQLVDLGGGPVDVPDLVMPFGKVFSPPIGFVRQVPFSAGNFTASATMTWTVELADQVSYGWAMLGERLMLLYWTINGTSVGGPSSTELRIRIPGGFVGAVDAFNPTLGAIRSFDNGSDTVGFCGAVAGANYLRLWRGGFAPWSPSTNNTSVQGYAIFQVE